MQIGRIIPVCCFDDTLITLLHLVFVQCRAWSSMLTYRKKWTLPMMSDKMKLNIHFTDDLSLEHQTLLPFCAQVDVSNTWLVSIFLGSHHLQKRLLSKLKFKQSCFFLAIETKESFCCSSQKMKEVNEDREDWNNSTFMDQLICRLRSFLTLVGLEVFEILWFFLLFYLIDYLAIVKFNNIYIKLVYLVLKHLNPLYFPLVVVGV